MRKIHSLPALALAAALSLFAAGCAGDRAGLGGAVRGPGHQGRRRRLHAAGDPGGRDRRG
ncbi:hypothetical protein ACFQZ4_01480 [Catellatospora coxensis]